MYISLPCIIFPRQKYDVFFQLTYDSIFFYFYTVECLIFDLSDPLRKIFLNKLGSDLVFRLSTLSIWVDANPKSVR